MEWTLRHAAWLLSTYNKDQRNGATAHHMHKGGEYQGVAYQFATPVLWLGERDAVKHEAGSRWRVGIWLG